jgi:hypothetical protein
MLNQEHPAPFGALAELGALVNYLCVQLVLSTLGIATAFAQALALGVDVGGLCHLQSRMSRRAP